MSRPPLAAILTLGCKLNLADSGEVARGLRAAGFQVVGHLCEADAYVINTCSVTHVADQKSRRLVRSARKMSPAAPVAVTGCYPQSAGAEAATALGADLVTGLTEGDRARLVGFLAERARVTAASSPVPGTPLPLHTRSFIRAQAGCNDVCSFCIVPRTRGRERSRGIDDIVAEVSLAADGGAREAVITGTQLGAWGRDVDPPLAPQHLIAAILERTDIARLRFSSLQPQDITPGLLALWRDPRLMPHFHLALQSGSAPVLQRMRRRYSPRDFLLAAARIQAAVPDAAITTDVIAGFPGETEEDFADTLALCSDVGFARMHCFPYSPRSRTAAALMPGQLPAAERQERVRRLIALGEELSLAFRRRFAGTVRPVLWEDERSSPEGRWWHGHTDNYIPVFAPGQGLGNRVTPALLGAVYHDGVLATLTGGEE
ncbi:MAG: MiaB/RimO family radical SAM methylthiotransferase [Dehalococcoidia bacterium]|nr:MiaB/RimO family radical SAM methylthiotransferase [Dehalococcoidia bacterium]